MEQCEGNRTSFFAYSKNEDPWLLTECKMAIFWLSFIFCFFLFFLDKHASIFAKKGNEHTWFWRKKTGGGADLPCCVCELCFAARFLLLFCFCILVRPSFAFQSPVFPIVLSPLLLFYSLRSPSLGFLSSLTLPSLFFLPLCSVPPLAFIAKGCRHFL